MFIGTCLVYLVLHQGWIRLLNISKIINELNYFTSYNRPHTNFDKKDNLKHNLLVVFVLLRVGRDPTRKVPPQGLKHLNKLKREVLCN